MAVTVINSKLYSNPYQQLLFRAINHRYRMTAGTIKDALELSRAGEPSIYHIHWEEAIFARCSSGQEANEIRREFIRLIKRYKARGGRIAWTVHNSRPHECRFTRSFHELRKSLAALADRILVHNTAAKELVNNLTAISEATKIQILPHPAYFGVYEPEEQTYQCVGQMPQHPRTVLHFGLIREYKGIPKLLEALSPAFMQAHELNLHIWGKPLLSNKGLDELRSLSRDRNEVHLRLSEVAHDDVAHVLRSYAGIVIPYSHVVSSGVAMLALTLGVPAIAPRTSAMQELFPEAAHSLLFDPSSERDLQTRVERIVNLSRVERLHISECYLGKAQEFHPHKLSNCLGNIYDELLGLSTDYSEL